MPLSEEQAQAIKESIDSLTDAVVTLNSRLQGVAAKLGIVAGAIKSSSDSKKQ
jgi:hypothetical protein